MKLRPYQTKIIAEVIAKWQSGKRRIIATAPTGSGKTVLFAKIADKLLTDFPNGERFFSGEMKYPKCGKMALCLNLSK